MTAVFDAPAIAKRRRELFHPEPPDIPIYGRPDRERCGTPAVHCGICPKPADELCMLGCEAERQKLNDGVVVTVASPILQWSVAEPTIRAFAVPGWRKAIRICDPQR